MTTAIMLQCGHAANATDGNGKPSCAICIGLHPGASTPATVRPNLEGRQARCFCGKTEPSNIRLPFFEYRGPGSRMSQDTCRHCGYADCAHDKEHMAKNVPSNRQTVVEQGKCKGFELLSEGRPFNSYYCLCAGTD